MEEIDTNYINPSMKIASSAVTGGEYKNIGCKAGIRVGGKEGGRGG